MSGAAVTKMRPKAEQLSVEKVTPEKAVQMLERNTLNRPLSDGHVQRIARQIKEGKWKFNGDTIKIANTGDVLDGQHRLWAIAEAKTTVETIIVRDIERDAFSTIDTIRRLRSGADTIALAGATRHRNIIAPALTWLLRWQRGNIEAYLAPQNRIENSDVEDAYANHPGIARAVERAMQLRRLANPSLIAFLYYVIHNRDEALAERMMSTLEDPSSIPIHDPFFRLRAYFTADHHKRKEPLVTIALTIKAANAASKKKTIEQLTWKSQGKAPEAFPTLGF